MTLKEVLGLLATLVSVVGFVHYLWTVLKGRTKPHAITWGIWVFVSGIVFTAQWQAGAAAGAWVTAVSCLFLVVIFAYALLKGERRITRLDWLCLAGALMIIPFWRLTHDALLAVLFAMVIDTLAYYPTIRKAWRKPAEESAFIYGSDTVKWALATLAMGNYSATALLYPLFFAPVNGGMALMILWRRKKLAGNAKEVLTGEVAE